MHPNQHQQQTATDSDSVAKASFEDIEDILDKEIDEIIAAIANTSVKISELEAKGNLGSDFAYLYGITGETDNVPDESMMRLEVKASQGDVMAIALKIRINYTQELYFSNNIGTKLYDYMMGCIMQAVKEQDSWDCNAPEPGEDSETKLFYGEC